MAINQKGAQAGGDIVAGNKTEIHKHVASTIKPSKLEQLKIRLQREVEDGRCSATLIEQLQNFQKRIPADGIEGLVAKLEVSGRASQIITALEMKEQFAKLLERWSLYGSAQEIFVHLLAMAEYKYSHHISPLVPSLDQVTVDELIEEKIIIPAIEEVGIDVFSLDHHTAMGMVYWLAEQCRVRWHQ